MWQAARLSSACWSTVKVALEIRAFGYQDASLAEIDSFILYITSQKHAVCCYTLPFTAKFWCSFLFILQAKLFRVPIHSNYLWAIVSTSLIVVLILIEQGVLEFTIKL